MSAVGGLGIWDFTADAARAVLLVFAEGWDRLPVWDDGDQPDVRVWTAAFDVTGTDRVAVVAFLARSPAPGFVVVTHPVVVRVD